MELRLNLVFLGLVVSSAAALTASEPMAGLDPKAMATRRLGALEDAFARAPADTDCLMALIGAYVAGSRPELVVASVARAEPPARDAPEVVHQLARAQESLGHFQDARSAADRAYDACAQELGTEDGCSAGRLAVFQIHRNALARIVALGIDDPSDARIRAAYDLVLRRGTVYLGGG